LGQADVFMSKLNLPDIAPGWGSNPSTFPQWLCSSWLPPNAPSLAVYESSTQGALPATNHHLPSTTSHDQPPRNKPIPELYKNPITPDPITVSYKAFHHKRRARWPMLSWT
jgi:hypothetical protein